MTRALFAISGSIWHRFSHRLFHHYRPERHYMRGPGPAWHAKHDPVG